MGCGTHARAREGIWRGSGGVYLARFRGERILVERLTEYSEARGAITCKLGTGTHT